MREQTNNIEVSMSPGDIRNLPLTCYFTVWAAGVSNPAPRIKRHVHRVFACIDSCSFVLVSPAIALTVADLRVA